MKRRTFLVSAAVFFSVLGLVSVAVAGAITDPYYSLPAIPIAILAFTTAVLLYLIIFRFKREYIWLNIAVIIEVLFICALSGSVITDYSLNAVKKPYGNPIQEIQTKLNISKIERDIADFIIIVQVLNRSGSDIKIEKITIGPYEWVPEETATARTRTDIKMIFSVSDREIALNYYKQAINNGKVRLSIDGLIHYEYNGNSVQTRFKKSSVMEWHAQ